MKEWLKKWGETIGLSAAVLVALLIVARLVLGQGAPADFTGKIATPASEVRGAGQETVTPPKGITVYKAPAKAKLAKAGAIPQAAATDVNVSVIAASRVAASEVPTEITTVINKTTGESETYAAPAPRPFVAFENRGEITLDYGFKRSHGAGLFSAPVQAGRINIRQDVLSIKALHFGVSASAYTDGDYFIGAGVGYRW